MRLARIGPRPGDAFAAQRAALHTKKPPLPKGNGGLKSKAGCG